VVRTSVLVLGSLFVLLTPRYSSATDSNLSVQLGAILGSEVFCGLTYDQRAIQAFVEKNVGADDMQFASELKLMTDGIDVQNKQMSASEKTARCTQIRRVARSYGFLK
jgi:hypothetical protein